MLDHNSGKIGVPEFKEALMAFNILLDCPLDDTQIQELHHIMDRDKDGLLSLDDFLQNFEIVDTSTKSRKKKGKRRYKSNSNSNTPIIHTNPAVATKRSTS